MNALAIACAVCSTDLAVDRAEFELYVAVAHKSGRRGLDAVEAAYLAVKDPGWDRKSRAGRKPASAVVAAIWRGSPQRRGDADRRLQSRLEKAGGQWRDGPPPKKQKKPGRSLVADAIRDAARALHPGNTRGDREARQRIREALEARQIGFDGADWGAES